MDRDKNIIAHIDKQMREWAETRRSQGLPVSYECSGIKWKNYYKKLHKVLIANQKHD